MGIRDQIMSRDYHVHTFRSVCARKEMTVRNIIRRAERKGYRELGISDHIGDYNSPAGLRRNRALIRRVPTAVRVYLGCEMCVRPSGELAVPSEELGFLDYLMVGVEHVVGGCGSPVADPRRWLRDWIRRLERIIESRDRVDVVTHPFNSLVGYYRGRPLLAHLPWRRWEELLGGLAQRGTAIELRDAIENFDTCYDAMRQVYAIAKRCGVRFGIASDAHGLDRLGFQINWVPLAEELGLTAEDLWAPRRAATRSS
jgi:histidinol phosphatase-like PHP family hydrolase